MEPWTTKLITEHGRRCIMTRSRRIQFKITALTINSRTCGGPGIGLTGRAKKLHAALATEFNAASKGDPRKKQTVLSCCLRWLNKTMKTGAESKKTEIALRPYLSKPVSNWYQVSCPGFLWRWNDLSKHIKEREPVQPPNSELKYSNRLVSVIKQLILLIRPFLVIIAAFKDLSGKL